MRPRTRSPTPGSSPPAPTRRSTAGWPSSSTRRRGPPSSRIRVEPDLQGQGFATQIVEELERRARRAGYRAFVLNTGVDNEQARGFYESLGYACVRETTVEFEGVTLDLALYWSRLD
ncbi:GNAT family N-acetyltransferase [Halosimplex aquaticum]